MVFLFFLLSLVLEKVKNKVIEINKNYTNNVISEIFNLLKENKIIIMPSDTIYGFLTLPSQENKLRQIKRRDNKPFLYLISNLNQLKLLNIDIQNYKFILEKYWPGSITFILQQNNNKTIGVRMPEWSILQRIINNVGFPLISTSVNYSGKPLITDKEEIINEFSNKVDLIVIDKNYNQNISSTIVDISKKPFKVLREGSVYFEII